MVLLSDIQSYADAIAREFHPQRIILFGSYARGDATVDSDVDLLVILPGRGDAASRSLDIRLRLEAGFPMDLIARTEGEVRRRLSENDWFLHDVLDEGIVLYDQRNAGVARKGRSRLSKRPA
ncbi:MAG: nucleotidyltransferase domain-containing protein [Phycisphaerales bacterium]|nr:nucleotidyltransferase domain-containing protein [Phycisphaerales bacterium]